MSLGLHLPGLVKSGVSFLHLWVWWLWLQLQPDPYNVRWWRLWEWLIQLLLPCLQTKPDMIFTVSLCTTLEETFIPLMEQLEAKRMHMDRVIMYCQHQDEGAQLYLLFCVRLGEMSENFQEPQTYQSVTSLRCIPVEIHPSVPEEIVKAYTSLTSPLRILTATIAFGRCKPSKWCWPAVAGTVLILPWSVMKVPMHLPTLTTALSVLLAPGFWIAFFSRRFKRSIWKIQGVFLPQTLCVFTKRDHRSWSAIWGGSKKACCARKLNHVISSVRSFKQEE